MPGGAPGAPGGVGAFVGAAFEGVLTASGCRVSPLAKASSVASVCRRAGGSNSAFTSRGGLSSTIARCSLPRYFSRSSSLAASRKIGSPRTVLGVLGDQALG